MIAESCVCGAKRNERWLLLSHYYSLRSAPHTGVIIGRFTRSELYYWTGHRDRQKRAECLN